MNRQHIANFALVIYHKQYLTLTQHIFTHMHSMLFKYNLSNQSKIFSIFAGHLYNIIYIIRNGFERCFKGYFTHK